MKTVRAESEEQLRSRARMILRALKRKFPHASTALRHANPFQLLVATILSAQCTDERVNKVTPGLFKQYPAPADFAGLHQETLEKEIRTTGFYRMKAKNIIGCSKAIVERHGGKVPASMEELILLSGVGRKTANVVLGQSFGIVSGIVVDTHVHRLSQRMGFTKAKDAGKAEEDLMAVFPKEEWIDVGSILILHGRETCSARKPDCSGCVVAEFCPSRDSFGPGS